MLHDISLSKTTSQYRSHDSTAPRHIHAFSRAEYAQAYDTYSTVLRIARDRLHYVPAGLHKYSDSLGADKRAEKVLIVTVDGRTLVGTLIAVDQVTNIVLQDTIERIIRSQDDDEPSIEQPQGLYVVRGDNVVICGLVDEELDGSIDWTKVRGEVIGTTKHA